MSTNSVSEDDLRCALSLAESASALALEFFRSVVGVQTKSDGSPVSAADLAVERQLLEQLAKERPDDAVIGEEFGSRGSSSRRWILDPIDGTSNFLAGRPEWGPHVALEDHGEIVIGVIARPATGQFWWAMRGAGAHRNTGVSQAGSTQLKVSSVDTLSRSRVAFWMSDLRDDLEQLARQVVRMPCDLNDILRLAEGQLEAVIDTGGGKIWDHAPAIVLVEEAGGCFSDGLGGRRPDRGEAWYTNGRIEPALRHALGASARH